VAIVCCQFILTRMEAVHVISLQSVITETQCRNKSRLGSEPPFYSNRYNYKWIQIDELLRVWFYKLNPKIN
jgi:hypothetical protein